MSARLTACLSGCALLLGVCGAHAQPPVKDVAARIEAILASPDALARARLAGRKAAFFCVNCHGENGNSVHEHIPNLAGQNPVYLLNQIDKFGDGRRPDPFMSGLVKVLKPDDRLNMAIHFSSLAVNPRPSRDAALENKGRELYRRLCQNCHGVEGRGGQQMARLAGQPTVYFIRSMERYRKGRQERGDPHMDSVARGLKDTDNAALAAYVSTMK